MDRPPDPTAGHAETEATEAGADADAHRDVRDEDRHLGTTAEEVLDGAERELRYLQDQVDAQRTTVAELTERYAPATSPPAIALHTETPVCVPCKANMIVKEVGVLMRVNADRITYADLYACPTCARLTVTAYANQPCDRNGPGSENFERYDALMGDSLVWCRRGEHGIP